MADMHAEPSKVRQVVLEIVSKYLEEGESIESRGDLLGVESLDLVDIVVEIETKLGIQFANEEIHGLETIDDLVALILTKMQAA